MGELREPGELAGTGAWLERLGAALGGAEPLSGIEAGLVVVSGLLVVCIGLLVVLLLRSRRDGSEPLVAQGLALRNEQIGGAFLDN